MRAKQYGVFLSSPSGRRVDSSYLEDDIRDTLVYLEHIVVHDGESAFSTGISRRRGHDPLMESVARLNPDIALEYPICVAARFELPDLILDICLPCACWRRSYDTKAKVLEGPDVAEDELLRGLWAVGRATLLVEALIRLLRLLTHLGGSGSGRA